MSQSDRKTKTVSFQISREAHDRLAELAAAGGLSSASSAARALLEELAPKIEAIAPRRGVSIKLRSDAAAANGSGSAAAVTRLKRGEGTPFDRMAGES